MFRKILVANRGEIARRIIRAVHQVGAKAVAVYSDADEHAVYINEADEAINIGPGPATQSYLHMNTLLAVAEQYECEAVHPGYGFLAENALFASRCEQQKLTFIGPKAHHMELMGDKATARKTMKALGIPVMPGSKDILHTTEEALSKAEEIGYPILLKATSGGGGKGMRLVRRKEDLPEQFTLAQAESQKAFGDPHLYMEKFLEGARHIEFQVLGDNYGHVIHLGERECSIQRKHQKLVEESPAFGLSADKRASIGNTITRALSQIGYSNAGTIELLMDNKGDLYFMEMNTRIQVEHPVTEMVTGLDLVAWQIRLAAGECLSLQQSDIIPHGHAIECRLNAEDPNKGFLPSPGTINLFDPPPHSFEGPIRLETHVQTGYTIPPFYDSMIGKLIVYGDNRAHAIERLRKALADFRIEGIANTLSFHRRLVEHPDFVKGGYTCQFLEQSGMV